VVTQQLEVRLPSGLTTVIDGKAHAALPRCIRLAAARRHVLLVGPAGSGKTHLAEQVATALSLDFAHISCSAGMSEGQLLGRLLPVGDGGKFEYVRSEFVRCYEEGGVFLFDEIDAADANTLLVLNAALANGRIALPNRPGDPVAKKHPDFVCIAAANTFGTGADRQYVGRSQLDESTLDRFRIGQVEMDYDAEVEAMLCPDDALRTRLQGYRQAVQRNRMRRVVSSRFLRDAYVMKRAGDTDTEIDAALFAGWSADEVRKVTGGVS
jgi:cobaltochelatase CobS